MHYLFAEQNHGMHISLAIYSLSIFLAIFHTRILLHLKESVVVVRKCAGGAALKRKRLCWKAPPRALVPASPRYLPAECAYPVLLDW